MKLRDRYLNLSAREMATLDDAASVLARLSYSDLCDLAACIHGDVDKIAGWLADLDAMDPDD